MHTETTPNPAREPARQAQTGPATPSVRFWPALLMVAVFWLLQVLVGRLEKPYFIGFLFAMGNAAWLALFFGVWWWSNRRILFRDRLYGCVLVLGLGGGVAPLCHPSFLFGLPTVGLPLVLTTGTLWLLLASRLAPAWNRLSLLVVVALTWGIFTLIRMDGVNADLQADMHWRWSPSAEDLFLAEKDRAASHGSSLQDSEAFAFVAAPGDWTGFRGPDRDGVIRGVRIDADWNAHPPRLLWKQRLGPGWSAVIVVGGRLFTQEQRGENETVVCYDAATGKELWVHVDAVRFWEAVSGAGPRATPTIEEGRLYALGATGILNCLDPVTGDPHWTRDIKADSGAKAPQWGFSGSPLILEGRVIVFAGGPGPRNLLAYDTARGELAWTAPVSHDSYSSPQAAVIDGRTQCLLLGDLGLTSVDPTTGAVLWEYGLALPGAPRAVQPHRIEGTSDLVGTFAGSGVDRITLNRDGDSWHATPVWVSAQMKPEFPDFVVHDGHLYGFDAGTLCCVDLETGERKWKAGRYGRGQVLLLAEQGLLLVVSESGKVILLEAYPRTHKVLGQFQALDGKTWNHPVIAHGRLFLRNDEEMACYELAAGSE